MVSCCYINVSYVIESKHCARVTFNLTSKTTLIHTHRLEEEEIQEVVLDHYSSCALANPHSPYKRKIHY